MAFYENTIIARQDLAENDLENIKNKYTDLIDDTSGKVIKIEMWGLLNFANKIKKHNRGFYIHYKFEGNNKTISEIRNKIKNDNLILRNLIVKYKKLDTKNEFFKKTK